MNIHPVLGLLMAFPVCAGLGVCPSPVAATGTDKTQAAAIDPATTPVSLLRPPPGAPTFGMSIAIAGNTVVVGAPGYDSGQGRAYVYTKTGGRWELAAQLEAPSGLGPKSLFGVSLAASSTSLALGATGQGAGRGRVYVFVRKRERWVESADITAPPGSLAFGSSISFSGGTLAVGASGIAPYISGSSGAPGFAHEDKGLLGHVYVFSGSGSSWKLSASFDGPRQASDGFGSRVVLTGGTLMAGTSQAGDNSVFIYLRTGSVWREETQLTQPGSGRSFFGDALALSGSTAVVTSPMQPPTGGVAYLFEQMGQRWKQIATLGVPGTDFGQSACASDNSIAISDPGADRGAGRVYIFTLSKGTWEKSETDAGGRFGASFGWTMTCAGGLLAVAGLSPSTSPGPVYLFTM